MTTSTEKWYAKIHTKNCLVGSENLQRDSFELSKREFHIKELKIEYISRNIIHKILFLSQP